MFAMIPVEALEGAWQAPISLERPGIISTEQGPSQGAPLTPISVGIQLWDPHVCKGPAGRHSYSWGYTRSSALVGVQLQGPSDQHRAVALLGVPHP